MILPGFEAYVGLESDLVVTPGKIAQKIVEHFMPTGSILDPCRGQGIFLEFLPNAFWCEVKDGKDFFEWWMPVDWIIGNPPYSNFSKFLRHSLLIAREIVYLILINKCFCSDCLLREIMLWGGIREILYIGSGTALNWPIHGYCIGAVNFSK